MAEEGRRLTSWLVPGFPPSIMQPALASSNRCDSFRAKFLWARTVAAMGLMNRKQRSAGAARASISSGFVLGLGGLALLAASLPAHSLELSAPQAALYSTVSIFPPSAQQMTVCYGFVCRRRVMLDFTAGDRSALTHILAAGRASAAAERAAVQKAVIWFDRRMGPVLGTDKRVAKADIRAMDDKHITIAGTPLATSPASCWCCSNGGCLNITRWATRITAVTRWYCKRRTTRRCWSSARPRSNGSSTCGRAAMRKRPMS